MRQPNDPARPESQFTKRETLQQIVWKGDSAARCYGMKTKFIKVGTVGLAFPASIKKPPARSQGPGPRGSKIPEISGPFG